MKIKKILTLFVFTLVAFISASTDIQAQTVEAKIEVKNISVDATSEMVDTGIVVMPGDTVKISAQGNTQHGAKVNWTYEGDTSKGDANGNFAFKKANQFALVGWIGDRKNYFQVSKTDTYPQNINGNLYLAINDWSKHYDNNVGGLTVNVTVTRYYEIKAEGTDAKAAWGNGLVKVDKGDTLSVFADGKVAYWQGGDLRDADGKDGKMASLLAPQINQSALIGKVGDGNPFKVGKAYKQENFDQNGWLYLSVNDEITKTGAFTNNSGNLKINVYVNRPSKTFKNPIK